MKRFKFLPVAIAIVLMVAAVSCTTMTGTQDDYYSGQRSAQVHGNRVYVEDPYRGTIVLEKDPWTGRYYEVNSYGTYGNRYYGSRSSSRGYGNPYYRRNNTGYYPRTNQQAPQETPQERKQNKDEARKKVLGN